MEKYFIFSDFIAPHLFIHSSLPIYLSITSSVSPICISDLDRNVFIKFMENCCVYTVNVDNLSLKHVGFVQE